MEAKILIRYTPKLAAVISRRNFQRQFTRRKLILLAVSWPMCAINCAVTGAQWFSVLLMGSLVALTFLIITFYITLQKRAVNVFRRFDPPEETWLFDDEGISLKSSLGESTILWKAIQELCRFPDVWFLCISNDAVISLPIEQVSQDLQREILKMIQANGGKVSG